MEPDTIELEVDLAGSPDATFALISQPDHVRQWWPDEARFEPRPGAVGELTWIDLDTGAPSTSAIEVVEVEPPRRFSFRWCFTGPGPTGPSLLVTFDLVSAGDGTRLRLRETGFAEMGWGPAAVVAELEDHEGAWEHYLAELGGYADVLADGG